jgi:hypothetical protein
LTIDVLFPASVAISRGDFLYWDGTYGQPANARSDTGTLAGNQSDFAPLFLGIAQDQRLVTETTTGHRTVVTRGVFDLTCSSTTWAVGDLVGIDRDSTNSVNYNQQVAKVTDGTKAIGVCIKAGASLTTVRVQLTSKVLQVAFATTGTTTFTSLVTNDLTAGDSSLDIVGVTGGSAAAGGTVAVAGGVGGATSGAGGIASSTGGVGTGTGAGGVARVVGGASGSGATGNGGAAQLTGGAAASTNGTGGAATIVGGAATGTGVGGAATITGGLGGATNAVGGAATVTAGAGQGTGAGAVASVVGGASGAGATGNGGVSKIVGGAAASTNGTGGAAQVTGGLATGTGTGGAVTILGGASGGASGTAGSIAIDPGAATGGTAGTVTIGGTNACNVIIGSTSFFKLGQTSIGTEGFLWYDTSAHKLKVRVAAATETVTSS